MTAEQIVGEIAATADAVRISPGKDSHAALRFFRAIAAAKKHTSIREETGEHVVDCD